MARHTGCRVRKLCCRRVLCQPRKCILAMSILGSLADSLDAQMKLVGETGSRGGLIHIFVPCQQSPVLVLSRWGLKPHCEHTVEGIHEEAQSGLDSGPIVDPRPWPLELVTAMEPSLHGSLRCRRNTATTRKAPCSCPSTGRLHVQRTKRESQHSLLTIARTLEFTPSCTTSRRSSEARILTEQLL